MITGIVAGHHACNSPVKETPPPPPGTGAAGFCTDGGATTRSPPLGPASVPFKPMAEERLWLEPRDKGRHCPAQTQGEAPRD